VFRLMSIKSVPETISDARLRELVLRAKGRVRLRRPLVAAELLEALVVVQRRLFGDNHPDTMTSVNNLGAAYWSGGHVGDGINLFKQNVARQREVLGDNHPDTMHSVDNLANAYRSAGRVDDAMTLHEQNLAHRREVLGDNHPDTMTTVT
jgi:Tetratricopeptide repeat